MIHIVVVTRIMVSVLKAKTRSETIGDEGGGKMTQTFTWSESNLGCLDSIWPLYLPLLDIGN
ncbi:MAG: hypothetical protein JXA13_02795 [Anaerolineales bacterium]|nr:hypothetical protein [Anaerolineales bacterium]